MKDFIDGALTGALAAIGLYGLAEMIDPRSGWAWVLGGCLGAVLLRVAARARSSGSGR